MGRSWNRRAREEVRGQIVAHGLTSSVAIAEALGLPYPGVVWIMERFEAAGALRLRRWTDASGRPAVTVVAGSLSDRFRDLASPPR